MQKNRKLFTRLMCLSMAIGILTCTASATFSSAANSSSDSDATSSSTAQVMNNVSVYFDYVEKEEHSIDAINSDGISTANLKINESVQLSKEESQILLDHEMFQPTFAKAAEIVSNGGTVKSIHFLLPASDNNNEMSAAATLASDDWRSHTFYLKTYNGFEFRYVDSYVEGETGYINVNDIGTVDWAELVKTGLKAVVPTTLEYLGVGSAGKLLSFAITLSDLVSAASVRPNITYSYSAQYYVRCNAMFRHYMRNIYMTDKNNIVPGYDYYIPGTAEQAEIDTHVSMRWPTKTSWSSSSGQVGSRQYITTDGYNGATASLNKFIQSYNQQKTYHENIELKKALIDIMLAATK